MRKLKFHDKKSRKMLVRLSITLISSSTVNTCNVIYNSREMLVRINITLKLKWFLLATVELVTI